MDNMPKIRKYTHDDEAALFALLEREGDEWSDYWRGSGRSKYRKALGSSIVYLVFEGDALCGYIRCRGDDGFGVYIYDLLVDKAHRGMNYGQLLMERACDDFPGESVYAMSDVDDYYGGKLGYKREGSIFIVERRK